MLRRGFLELAGGLILVGIMQPENPLVGGTVLRRAAIQSPNFVAGSAGWTVKQDGSAEFNNIVIRNGSVISGTALFYSGVPALGNLVASVAAAAGTDSLGNAYLAGITSYLGGASFGAVQLNGGMANFWNAPAAGGPWTLGPTVTANITDLFLNPTAAGFVHAVPLIVAGGRAGGNVLQVSNSVASPSSPSMQLIAQAVADFVLGVLVGGDTNQRFRIDSNGNLNWGTGAAPTDTSLSRSAAATLTVGSTLKTSGLIASGSAVDQVILSNGLAGGDVLKVTNTTAAPTGASAHLIAAAAADRLLALQVAGDTVTRLLVDSNGKMSWGPGGAAAQDVTMQRNAGHLDVTATDGNTYSAERLTQVNTGQTITSVSPSLTALTGLSAAVANGTTYRFRLWVAYNGSVAAGAPVFQVNGPTTSFSTGQLTFTTNGTAVVTQRGAGLNTLQTGPTFQTAQQLLVWEGIFTPSANGTLSLSGATNTSGDNLVINGATLELLPIA